MSKRRLLEAAQSELRKTSNFDEEYENLDHLMEDDDDLDEKIEEEVKTKESTKKKQKKKKQKKSNDEKKEQKNEEKEEGEQEEEDMQHTIQEFVQQLKDKESQKGKLWRNKQRVLILCARGTSSLYRHLMNDLRSLLPHSKRESKLDLKNDLTVLNEIAELKSCTSCIYFDYRRHSECFIWFSKTPSGPSAKFQLLNVHSLNEMEFPGNCLLGSRPIVTFDHHFDEEPQWKVCKEIFSQIFATPKGHPKSKPFVDHVISFYIQDKKIWFRCYQIAHKDDQSAPYDLIEIGPRFVMDPVRILAGSFHGETIYQNGSYQPLALRRTLARNDQKQSERYVSRVVDRKLTAAQKEELLQKPFDPLDTVFAEK